jgi:hypothetical protein
MKHLEKPIALTLLALALAACGNTTSSTTTTSTGNSETPTPTTSTTTSTPTSSTPAKTALAAAVISLSHYTASWSAVAHADGYKLYLNATLLKTSSDLSYDFDTTISTKQTLYVVANDSTNAYLDSVASNSIEFTAPASLAAPVISFDSASKTVSWSAVTNALTYMVFKNDAFMEETDKLNYVVSDTNVGAYSLAVKAKYGDLMSNYSNSVVYKILPATIATAVKWDRAGLYGDDWARTGSFDTGVGEGCDMKAGASMLMAHAITVDSQYLRISMRVFHREGETYPKFYVYVDGVVTRAIGSTSDFVTTDLDAGATFDYDLTAKVGQTVIIEFKEMASTHTCITGVSMVKALGASLSSKTSWSRSEFYDEWFREGSFNTGVGEGVDFTGSGAASIILNITADTKFFNVGIRQFENQDTDKAHLALYADGTLVKTAEGDDYAVASLDGSTMVYAWDLSAYVGKKVTFKFASLVSSVNHCVGTSFALAAASGSTLPGSGMSLATATTWTGSQISSDAAWVKSSGAILRNEGFDLAHGENAMVKIAIATSTKYLNIKSRMYAGQDTSASALQVKVNGVAIKAVNSDFDTFPVPVSDNEFIYTYNLSAYTELKPVITILNASDSTNHMILTNVEFSGTDSHTAADNYNVAVTDFDRSFLYSKWTISGNNSGVGEGVDLQGAGTMSYQYDVDATTKLVNVKTRIFNGQDSDNASFVFKVGTTVIKAINNSTDNCVLPMGTDDSTWWTFDLTSYVGTNVTISITSNNSKVNHMVVEHVTLNATDGHTNTALTAFYPKAINTYWTATNTNTINEGVDLASSGSVSYTYSVADATKILKVNSRIFSGQETVQPQLEVMVGTTIIKANGLTTDTASLAIDTDNTQIFQYDLSAYVGQSVTITVLSVQGSNNHLVLQSIYLVSAIA